MKKGQANWTSLLYHSLVFIGTHVVFVYMFGVQVEGELPSGSYVDHLQQHFFSHGVNFYENDNVNRISSIWKTILIIHLFWELIETVFPRKKAEKQAASNEPVIKPLVSSLSSNRAWAYVLLAGALEIVWASGLKYEKVPSIIVLVTLIVSFELIIKAVRVLPIGTAYAVFAGIGIIGTVIVEAVMTEGGISPAKAAIVLLLLSFVIGLKLTSGEGRQR